MDQTVGTIIAAAIGAGVTLLIAWVIQRPKARADALQIYDQIERDSAEDALKRIKILEDRVTAQDRTIGTQREQIAALISQLAESGKENHTKSIMIIDLQIELNQLRREIKELRLRLALYEGAAPTATAEG